MLVYSSWQAVAKKLAHGSLAIGNFDGVHIGHQALIKKAVELKGNSLAGLMTFSPHPDVFLGNKKIATISSNEDKLSVFKDLGVDIVIMEKLTQTFLAYSKEYFVEEILASYLAIKNIVVGHDFLFGHNASGDSDFLTKSAHKYGINVWILPPVLVNNERCSSSKIRELLALGNMPLVKDMLGRFYALSGVVIRGNQLGRMLGFPTANIMPPSSLALRHGVYASVLRVFTDSTYEDFYAASNVGIRPTVSKDNSIVIESYCLDKDINLYDKKVQVFFLAHMRDEAKFTTITALKEQIKKDSQMVAYFFQENPQLFHAQR